MREPQAYEFGDFRLDAARRRLARKSGEVIPLTPKAFETLQVWSGERLQLAIGCSVSVSLGIAAVAMTLAVRKIAVLEPTPVPPSSLALRRDAA